MDTPNTAVEPATHIGDLFEPITMDSGMTLHSPREVELWQDGYEQGVGTTAEAYEEIYETGNLSESSAEQAKAHIVLTEVRSMLPGFKLPTRRNGEKLVPASVSVRGHFIIVRYFGWEPIEGPTADRFFLDAFYNSEGSEVFRAQSKIVEAPPDPPKFFERCRFAFWVLLGEPRY